MDVDYPEAENLNQYNQIDIFRLWTGGRSCENKVLSTETGAPSSLYNDTRADATCATPTAVRGRLPAHHLARLGRRATATAATRGPGHNADELPPLGHPQPGVGRTTTSSTPTSVAFSSSCRPASPAPTSGSSTRSGSRACVRRRHRQRQTAMNWQNAHQGVHYRSTELQDNGYTYDYFSPKFLFDDDVSFDEKTKTIEKAGYKAVVLYQDWLDIDGAQAHPELGQEGPEGRHPGGRRHAHPVQRRQGRRAQEGHGRAEDPADRAARRPSTTTSTTSAPSPVATTTTSWRSFRSSAWSRTAATPSRTTSC